MRPVDPLLATLIFSGMIYLILVFLFLKSQDTRENLSISLIAFSIVSFGWVVFQILYNLQTQKYISGFDEFALQRIALYLLFVLAFILFHLTRLFERVRRFHWVWWSAGGILFSLAVVIYENWFRFPDLISFGPSLTITREVLGFLLVVAGEILFSLAAAVTSIRSYLSKSTPLHRNRSLYWAAVVFFFLISQIFFLVRFFLIASLLNTLTLAGAFYTWQTHHLPDLRSFARRGASYAIIALIGAALYTAGFFIIQTFDRINPTFQPGIGAFIFALFMVLLVHPFLDSIRRAVDRALRGSDYDFHQTLSEYSMSISNILNLEYLAVIVVNIISEAMDISHGTLMVVSNHTDSGVFIEKGGASYTVHVIHGSGQYIPDGTLSEKSPFVYTLREHHPLTQYDIDLLARFNSMEQTERAWLDHLGMDVYVPIYAKDTWIGILALGPKKSGERYYNEDLSILQTLADQTAIALENARLYENLKQRNTENEILNVELKQANKELARLDEAKSDFINIASHEMRTPLTQIIGYNDILNEMIKAKDLDYQTGGMMVNSVHKAARRLEEIVETMFDVSKLETRTLDLNRMPITLASVITVAIDTWTKGIHDRKQTISVHGIANLPPVIADGKRLAQVFSNLIQNSIKSTPDGGHIRITGKLISGEKEKDDSSCIEIVIEDNGIGIAPDDLERIFLKFYRVGSVLLHSTGDTKFKGAGPGLGLTIARGIVEAHGGNMWAESPGHDEATCPGSKFHVILPLKPTLPANLAVEA